MDGLDVPRDKFVEDRAITATGVSDDVIGPGYFREYWPVSRDQTPAPVRHYAGTHGFLRPKALSRLTARGLSLPSRAVSAASKGEDGAIRALGHLSETCAIRWLTCNGPLRVRPND